MEDALLARIYEAPLARHPWRDLAAALRHSLRARGVIFRFTPHGAPHEQSTFAFDAAWDTSESWPHYGRIFQHMDPTCRKPMLARKIYDFASIEPLQRAEDSAYYHRFCQSIGTDHGLFVYLGEYEGLNAWVSIGRDQANGGFGYDDATFIEELLPHLSRALVVHARLEASRASTVMQEALFNPLGLGIFIVDAGGRILNMNAVARTQLASAGPLRRAGKYLRIIVDRQDRLPALLWEAHSVSYEKSPPMLSIVQPERQTHVLVKMQPEKITSGMLFAVHVESWPLQVKISAAAVAKRFGLTGSEAALAALLAEGRSIEEAGAVMGITNASARTYCKRALAKTATRRQADLVRLILTSLVHYA